MPEKCGFFGNYKNYEEVLKFTEGYEKNEIIEYVYHQTLQGIKTREQNHQLNARYQQLLAALYIAQNSMEDGLTILDFGGALGAHYFSIINLLRRDTIKNWIVCETSLMSSKGQQNLADNKLKFISNIEECKNVRIDIVLASCSLQYLEDPMKMLETLIGLNAGALILNRVPFIDEEKDRLTLQVVPEQLHGGSMPAWFFSKSKWMSKLLKKYQLIAQWPVPEDVVCLDGKSIVYQGFVLKRNDS